MYENLLSNYRLFFEGVPAPIFYDCFYAMGDKFNNDELWAEFNYIRGLKGGKRDPNGDHYQLFYQQYINDLRQLFNYIMQDFPRTKRGVLVIPSSDTNKANIVTKLVREVIARNPGPIDDLTQFLLRWRDKDKASSGGTRSVQVNKQTLTITPDVNLAQYDLLIVIDDVVTTGSSFIAVDELLAEAGFKGTIINFAFGHTFNSEGAYNALEFKGNSNHGAPVSHVNLLGRPVRAMIFDFDQTLVHGQYSVLEDMKDDERAFEPYDGLDSLFESNIPYAIVSNRSESRLEKMISSPNVLLTLYPCSGSIRRYGLPENVFVAPVEVEDGFKVHFYKPSTRGIEMALDWLDRSNGISREDRIIGIGNTYEDILAYNVAGIESVIALWGVPKNLRRHAMEFWGASHAFETTGDFVNWCQQQALDSEHSKWLNGLSKGSILKHASFGVGLVAETGYDDAAGAFLISVYFPKEEQYKRLDPRVAPISAATLEEYYEERIASGDTKDAPYELAKLLEGKDDARVYELVKLAADSGNPSAATNFGRWKFDDSPEVAIAYFEKAIESGDDLEARVLLARLIRNEDRLRAIELLEHVIDAGGALDSVFQLAYTVAEDDPDRAISLYERAIQEGDELAATNNLGLLLLDSDPVRAEELFRRAVAAGNQTYATKNLARLIKDRNREESVELFEIAVDHRTGLGTPLELAELIYMDDPDRAAELVAIDFDEGNLGACYLLPYLSGHITGDILMKIPKTPQEVEDSSHLFLIGVFWMLLDSDIARERALSFFEESLTYAEGSGAKCNLGLMMATSNPDKAIEYYEQSLDQTESVLGLSWLLRDTNPERSQSLKDQAFSQSNIGSSLCFIAFYLRTLNPEMSKGIYKKAYSLGTRDAAYEYKLAFGEDIDNA